MTRSLERRYLGIDLPASLLACRLLRSWCLTVFVLPRFQGFFASLHAKLPLVTALADVGCQFHRYMVVRRAGFGDYLRRGLHRDESIG